MSSRRVLPRLGSRQDSAVSEDTAARDSQVRWVSRLRLDLVQGRRFSNCQVAPVAVAAPGNTSMHGAESVMSVGLAKKVMSSGTMATPVSMASGRASMESMEQEPDTCNYADADPNMAGGGAHDLRAASPPPGMEIGGGEHVSISTKDAWRIFCAHGHVQRGGGDMILMPTAIEPALREASGIGFEREDVALLFLAACWSRIAAFHHVVGGVGARRNGMVWESFVVALRLLNLELGQREKLAEHNRTVRSSWRRRKPATHCRGLFCVTWLPPAPTKGVEFLVGSFPQSVCWTEAAVAQYIEEIYVWRDLWFLHDDLASRAFVPFVDVYIIGLTDSWWQAWRKTAIAETEGEDEDLEEGTSPSVRHTATPRTNPFGVGLSGEYESDTGSSTDESFVLRSRRELGSCCYTFAGYLFFAFETIFLLAMLAACFSIQVIAPVLIWFDNKWNECNSLGTSETTPERSFVGVTLGLCLSLLVVHDVAGEFFNISQNLRRIHAVAQWAHQSNCGTVEWLAPLHGSCASLVINVLGGVAVLLITSSVIIQSRTLLEMLINAVALRFAVSLDNDLVPRSVARHYKDRVRRNVEDMVNSTYRRTFGLSTPHDRALHITVNGVQAGEIRPVWGGDVVRAGHCDSPGLHGIINLYRSPTELAFAHELYQVTSFNVIVAAWDFLEKSNSEILEVLALLGVAVATLGLIVCFTLVFLVRLLAPVILVVMPFLIPGRLLFCA